jgi:tetratricopeptide (TPR) repeat protein
MVNSTLTEDRENWVMLAIFFLSVTLKFTILYFIADPIIFNKYPYFAEQLSRGIDIGERILDLSPLYLYLAVIFYKTFGSNWDLIIILQVLLGSLNCVFTYYLGRKIFGEIVGLIAAALLILYGNITLIELTLEPEALLIFLNTLAVTVLLKTGKTEELSFRFWNWFLPGLLIGLAAITKANALLIIPGALVWIWFSVKSRKQRCKAAAIFLLGVFVVVSPITIRNYLLFEDVVLITADGGKVFYHGNGPGATGMERADLPNQGFIEETQTEPDYAHTLFRETARKLSRKPLKPSECSTYWFLKTVSYICEEPGLAAGLAWKKLCLFWNNYEIHDLDSTYKDYKTLQRWPLVGYGLLSVLGLLGMGSALGMFRRSFMIYWMVLIYLFSSIVFFPASRYRLPAVPFICIFASVFIADWISYVKRKDLYKYAGALALVPLLIAWSYLPFRQEIDLFDRWQQISRIHYNLGGRMAFKRGDYQQALQEFKQVVSFDPSFAPAYNYMGKTYAILGQLDLAQECFRRVIELSPNVDEGYLNQGLLSELRGESSRAGFFYEKALSLNPNNKSARTHLMDLRRAYAEFTR